jgi:hypothetical protein
MLFFCENLLLVQKCYKMAPVTYSLEAIPLFYGDEPVKSQLFFS